MSRRASELAALSYPALLEEIAGHRLPASALGALADEAGRGALRRGQAPELVRAGLSAATARRICAAVALARHLEHPGVAPGPFRSPHEVYERFRDLAWAERESFWSLALDARHRELRRECVALGGASRCALRPGEVLAPILRAGAVAAIFVHNHPSGDPSPSDEDVEVTRRLASAGELLGLRVLDHLIVGRGAWVSLKERGVLD